MSFLWERGFRDHQEVPALSQTSSGLPVSASCCSSCRSDLFRHLFRVFPHVHKLPRLVVRIAFNCDCRRTDCSSLADRRLSCASVLIVPAATTGRKEHKRCAVLESLFAALNGKEARASWVVLRGTPGIVPVTRRAGAEYLPHNIVIGLVGAHARHSAARERHRCARLRRACGRSFRLLRCSPFVRPMEAVFRLRF